MSVLSIEIKEKNQLSFENLLKNINNEDQSMILAESRNNRFKSNFN